MSNGYIVAAGNDLAAAQEIGAGFGLDVIEAGSIELDTVVATLGAAPSLGLLISTASAADPKFVAVLEVLAQHLQRAQLILIDADARAALPFLPSTWPAMSLEDTRARIAALARPNEPTTPQDEEVAAAPPAQEGQTQSVDAIEGPQSEELSAQQEPQQPEPQEAAPSPAAAEDVPAAAAQQDENAPAEAPVEGHVEGVVPADDGETHRHDVVQTDEGEVNDDAALGAGDVAPVSAEPESEPAPASPPEPSQQEIEAAITTDRDLPTMSVPIERPPESAAPPSAPAPAPSAPAGESVPAMPKQDAPLPDTKLETARTDIGDRVIARERRGYPPGDLSANARPPSAPADATAFAPKKLRRGSPELVRIAIHQPKDLKEVIKAAKKADPRTDAAPQSVSVGEVQLGASVGVALEVKGAFCEESDLQRQEWTGAPLDFNFTVEADDDSKQAIIKARVFINDAQIGTITFLRPVSGPKKKAADAGKGERMQKVKRVFISYSSKDRELVAAIATAYAAAGVPHFWDRASLKSGEIWNPRLRKEIDRADLFHLCWSKSAADSEWVEKETEHALDRNRRSKGKAPSITVQMLDGPPWAKHKDSLDAINFDDFTRAAIVGYARGDGSN